MPRLRRLRKAFEYAALDGRERLVSYFYWLGPDSVRGLVRADREGRIDAAYTIFAVVCIEVWCRMFLENYSGR